MSEQTAPPPITDSLIEKKKGRRMRSCGTGRLDVSDLGVCFFGKRSELVKLSSPPRLPYLLPLLIHLIPHPSHLPTSPLFWPLRTSSPPSYLSKLICRRSASPNDQRAERGISRFGTLGLRRVSIRWSVFFEGVEVERWGICNARWEGREGGCRGLDMRK